MCSRQADSSNALVQAQGCQEEYVNEKLEEMRCKLGRIPWAFPRMKHFPMSWKVVHALVYGFLKNLNLESTLTVYTVESEMKNAMDLVENGWFLNSFILSQNFKSTLVHLMQQFQSQSDRIRQIIQNDDCSSDEVRNKKERDAEKFAEAQRILVAQQEDGCSMRQGQSQQESECRRRIMEQQRQAECRMREECQRRREEECRMQQRQQSRENCNQEDHEQMLMMQEEIARRALEVVGAASRNKILESIRAMDQQMDNDAEAEMEEHRARIQRQRECDRIVETERLAMEAVLANTRQRIIDDMVAKQEEMAREACRKQKYGSASARGRTFSVDNNRRSNRDSQIASICNRAGINMNPTASRRHSIGGGAGYGPGVDPRANQSFRAIHRNKHTGWRMEPLESDPSIVVTANMDNTVVYEPEDLLDQMAWDNNGMFDEGHCENHPNRRPSQIPRIYQPVHTSRARSQSQYNHGHQSPVRGRGADNRASLLRRQSITANHTKCDCQTKERTARDTSCHFSKRGSRMHRKPRKEPGMNCVLEN